MAAACERQRIAAQDSCKLLNDSEGRVKLNCLHGAVALKAQTDGALLSGGGESPQSQDWFTLHHLNVHIYHKRHIFFPQMCLVLSPGRGQQLLHFSFLSHCFVRLNVTLFTIYLSYALHLNHVVLPLNENSWNALYILCLRIPPTDTCTYLLFNILYLFSFYIFIELYTYFCFRAYYLPTSLVLFCTNTALPCCYCTSL